jgi:hypothetical protein
MDFFRLKFKNRKKEIMVEHVFLFDQVRLVQMSALLGGSSSNIQMPNKLPPNHRFMLQYKIVQIFGDIQLKVL